MVRRVLPAGLLLLVTGCLDQESLPLVQPNPFNSTPSAVTAHVACSPASEEAATRVGVIGQKLITANERLAVRPLFRTVGSPTPEIFHRGTSEILITEGLVKQCTTDAQLAAVLSQELGKMVSEREAGAGALARNPDRGPPPHMAIGNDVGAGRPADMTYLAEQAPYDNDRRRAMAPPPPPDPKVLARDVLVKAGYAPGDLDAAAPLLRSAAENRTIEKQFSTASPVRPWSQ